MAQIDSDTRVQLCVAQDSAEKVTNPGQDQSQPLHLLGLVMALNWLPRRPRVWIKLWRDLRIVLWRLNYRCFIAWYGQARYGVGGVQSVLLMSRQYLTDTGWFRPSIQIHSNIANSVDSSCLRAAGFIICFLLSSQFLWLLDSPSTAWKAYVYWIGSILLELINPRSRSRNGLDYGRLWRPTITEKAKKENLTRTRGTR